MRFYRCHQLGHKPYECLENMGTNHRNAIVAQVGEEAARLSEMEEEFFPERGESLVVNKVLIKRTEEVAEQAQRKTLFRSVCKVQGKCCQLVIDSGNTDNLDRKSVV